MTLIETLLVLAIIGVLVGLSLAAVQQVRRSAARSGCSNQLRQIGLALNHHQAVHGIYPPQNPSLSGSEGSPYTHEGIGWTTYLLPFIEREDLWTKVRAAYAEDPDPWSAPHAGIRATVVKTYVCPADARLNAVLQDGDGWRGGFTSYVGMTGYTWKPKSGLFGRGVGVAPSAITDGLSHTVCVGERPPPASLSMGWWYTTHVYPNLMSATDFEVPADMGGAPGDPGCPGFRTRWPGEGVVVQHSFVRGRSSTSATSTTTGACTTAGRTSCSSTVRCGI